MWVQWACLLLPKGVISVPLERTLQELMGDGSEADILLFPKAYLQLPPAKGARAWGAPRRLLGPGSEVADIAMARATVKPHILETVWRIKSSFMSP